jgi:F-type H+-transporting ATPase subunit b
VGTEAFSLRFSKVMIEINGTFIAILVNFIILVFILNHFLYKPLMDIIDERRSIVAHTLAESQARMSSAQAFMEEGRATIAKANQSAKGIIDEASNAAEKMINESADKAKHEAEDMRVRAKEEIAQYRLEAKKALMAETGNLSAMIAEKIIMKKIDKATQEEMVEKYTGRFS